MKKCLLVRIPPTVSGFDRDARVQWGIFSGHGDIIHGVNETPVHQLRSDWQTVCHPDTALSDTSVYPDQVIVFLPASWTVNRELSVNSGQKKHIHTALPFLIEEEVIGDVERLHICHYLDRKDSHVSLIGIAHDAMRNVLSVFEQEGLQPDSIYSENNFINHRPQEATLLLDSGHLTMISPGYAPVPVAYEAVPFALAKRVEASNDPIPLGTPTTATKDPVSSARLIVPDDISEQTEKQRLSLVSWLTHQGWLFEEEPFPSSLFEFYVSQYYEKRKLKAAGIINLRYGAYACPRRASRRMKQWRPLAVVILAGVVISLGVSVGKGVYFSEETNDIWHENADTYLRLYPNDRQVKEAKARDRVSFDIQGWLENRIKNSGKQLSHLDKDFLPLLQVVSSVAGEQGQKIIMPRSMDFNSESGHLLIEFQAPNLEVVNKMMADLKSHGLQTQLDTANQEKAGVIAKMTVAR